jgi:hypothetical protein
LRQPRKLFFGMQPYFDPTRKTTSQKNGKRPQVQLRLFNNKNLKNKWF